MKTTAKKALKKAASKKTAIVKPNGMSGIASVGDALTKRHTELTALRASLHKEAEDVWGLMQTLEKAHGDLSAALTCVDDALAAMGKVA